MKNINFKKYLYLIFPILFAASCTSRFEELNTNDYGFSNNQLEQDFNNIRALFIPMQNSVYMLDPVWQTQLQQNLIGDVYSGYLMPPTPFASNINNMNYALVDGWNGFAWSIAYTNVMPNALKIKLSTETKYPAFYAWSLILKVEAMHRVADIYGPIVYSDFGNSDTVKKYDDVKTVYYAFFADLGKAIDILTPLATSGQPKLFSPTDLTLYDGDYSKWVKFANTLRLRLATRIAMIDPAKAKMEAEKSIANAVGVMTDNTDAAVLNNPNYKHPLFTMCNAWGDTRMGAPMESILKGYTDPRLSIFFKPSTIVAGDYKGIRNGIAIASKNDYVTFSSIGDAVINTTKVTWLTTAEAYFLRAEGALRGWNMGGTADSFYNQGIAKSFDQYGIAGAAAYANTTTTATPYVDPVNAANNVAAGSPYLNGVGVKWVAGDSNELKLQKIITQKWISLFPDGQEAWTEFRRTGYPKLFPVVINNSGGKISTTGFIRRVNFPASEVSGNPTGYQTALTALGGADNGGTKLWWDTGSNF